MNPVNTESASTCVESGSILSQIFRGPMFIIVVVAILLLGTSWWKDRQDREAFNKIKIDLCPGKVIKMSDGTVGTVVSVDQTKGTFIFKSAETTIEKTLESIIFVYPETEVAK